MDAFDRKFDPLLAMPWGQDVEQRQIQCRVPTECVLVDERLVVAGEHHVPGGTFKRTAQSEGRPGPDAKQSERGLHRRSFVVEDGASLSLSRHPEHDYLSNANRSLRCSVTIILEATPSQLAFSRIGCI